MKLWEGRFHKALDPKTNDFNSSISFDSRMAAEDIQGSIAHATMLGACGIISQEDVDLICAELPKIAAANCSSTPTRKISIPLWKAN